MNKLVEQPVSSVNRIHIFHCDVCGKELGTTVEYDDGYYPELGSYKRKMYMDSTHDWYAYTANLCEKCASVKDAEIVQALNKLGFNLRQD